MNGFLVDTNVLSEFGKTREPDANVRRWVETADPGSLFASVVTWGELRKGIESKPPDQRPLA
jgi:predicted nucleic acid-binding protein